MDSGFVLDSGSAQFHLVCETFRLGFVRGAELFNRFQREPPGSCSPPANAQLCSLCLSFHTLEALRYQQGVAAGPKDVQM